MAFESKSANTFHRPWVQRLVDIQEEMKKRSHELSRLIVAYDHKSQECLHFLELEQPNAALQAKVARVLKETRQKRRQAKEELYDIQTALSHLKLGKKPKTEVDRSYTYSEDFLKELFGEQE